MNYRALYARLFLSMSMEDARKTLGFPPGYSPSPGEIAKAYKSRAIENHPDRGGSHEVMVAINVAKEILEGKRREDRTPFRPPPVDPEKARREEEERKRTRALSVIDNAAQEVGRAIEACLASMDIGRGKIHLREFFTDDYADAINKMQDMIDDSPNKAHPDMRKADALCTSLSNKAMRLGKKYLNLLKLHGEVAAGLLGMGGTAVTYSNLADLYAETAKYIASFNEMYQESRKLIGLIRMSENVPIEWDDIYHRPHDILDTFATSSVGGWKTFSDSSLKAYSSVLERGLKDIGSAMLAVAPEEWKKAPSADLFRYPDDFEWAKDAVKGKDTSKNAALARRVAARFTKA